jgi:hypothetical protein
MVYGGGFNIESYPTLTSSIATILNLTEVLVRPVRPFEERRYQELMQEHPFLSSLPKTAKRFGILLPGAMNGWTISAFPRQPGSAKNGITGAAGTLAEPGRVTLLQFSRTKWCLTHTGQRTMRAPLWDLQSSMKSYTTTTTTACSWPSSTSVIDFPSCATPSTETVAASLSPACFCKTLM